MLNFFKFLYFSAFLAIGVQETLAGVIIGGTRVIYDGAKREASISVRNAEVKLPYLMQSWVENSDAENYRKTAFVITPPLFRLDAGQENILRIVRTGEPLPNDRESLYWLNIKSIPASAKTDKNTLQIAFKTRIKLIYRPKGLSNNAIEAYKNLKFIKHDNELKVVNPTPYYVAFYSVKVGGHIIEDAGTIGPKGTLIWQLPAGVYGSVSWQTINDFGGITPIESKQL
ncbi:fimbrial biogenesis chaperone [Klebsiella oxytoca]|uniref:fimbrial biogenesis chaperone n=1 Tax=Klebsiella oxytoca TaxID=571 RepID=UPI0038790F16